MGLLLFPGTLSNNCSVLSGSNLQHTNATSSTLSAVVFMSQIIIYTVRLNVPLHMYIENKITRFTYIALQVLLVLCGIWSLDFFRFVVPTFCVSKQSHDCSCICTEVFSGNLSHLSHFNHVCIHKTPDHLFGIETFSKTFCSLQEEMRLQIINNQCIYNICASHIIKRSYT